MEYRQCSIDLGNRFRVADANAKRARTLHSERLANAMTADLDARSAIQCLSGITLQSNERSVAEFELDVPLRCSTGRIVDDHLMDRPSQRFNGNGGRLRHGLRRVCAGFMSLHIRRAKHNGDCGECRRRSNQMH